MSTTTTIRVAAFCSTPAWLYRRVGTAHLPRIQFRARPRSFGHASCAGSGQEGPASSPGGSTAGTQPPKAGFKGLGLSSWMTKSLESQGFQRPTSIQSLAIPVLGTGRDAVVAAETGSGKTVAYLAPLLNRVSALARDSSPAAVLVICPNAALAEQVAATARTLLGPRAGPAGAAMVLSRHAPLPAMVPAVVAATPGSLASLLRATAYDGADAGPWVGDALPRWARCVVLDEADMLLGGSYRRDLGAVLDLLAVADRHEAAEAVSAALKMAPGEFARLPRHQRRAAEAGGVPALVATGWPAAGGESRHRQDSEVTGDAGSSISLESNDDGGDGVMGAESFVDGSSGPQSGVASPRTKAPTASPVPQRPGGRQYVFAGATLPREGKREVGAWLRQTFPGAAWLEGPRLHRTPAGAAARAHEWVAVPQPRARDAALARLFASAGPGVTLVFARDVPAAEQAVENLQALTLRGSQRPELLCFHARVPAEEREAMLRMLRAAPADGPPVVLVATDAAARGLDVPGVNHVIQADFASSAVDFLHRVGRTARAGRTGKVTSLYFPEEEPLVKALQAAIAKDEPVEGAFSRKRSFRKKFKRYGEYIPRGQTAPAKAAL